MNAPQSCSWFAKKRFPDARREDVGFPRDMTQVWRCSRPQLIGTNWCLEHFHESRRLADAAIQASAKRYGRAAVR